MGNQLAATSGPVILDIGGQSLTVEDIELLRHPATAGVILFSRNLVEPSQVAELCREIRSHRRDLLICIDQEGGRVQRLRQGVTKIPPMAKIGQVYNSDASQGIADARDIGWILASELRCLGIDLSLAPVLDLDSDICPAIGDRSFGLNPKVVATLARSFIEGMYEAGMAAVGKHFPGHGKVSLDSHFDLPIDQRPLASLWDDDIYPFMQLCGKNGTGSPNTGVQLLGIMPAHIIFDQVDSNPVGFSKIWLQDILRQRLGFTGLIFSDDLNMAAADEGGSYGDRAQLALKAGCDLVLICNNRQAAIEVLDATTTVMKSRAYKLKCNLLAEPVKKMSVKDDSRRRTVLQRLNLDCYQ